MACLRFLHWKLTSDLIMNCLGTGFNSTVAGVFELSGILLNIIRRNRQPLFTPFPTLMTEATQGSLRILPTPFAQLPAEFQPSGGIWWRILQARVLHIMYCYLKEVLSRSIVMIDLEIVIRVLFKGNVESMMLLSNGFSLMMQAICASGLPRTL